MAATSLAFFVFLFLFIVGSDVPCDGNVCRNGDVTGAGAKSVKFADSVKRILRWTGFFADRSWEETDDRYFSTCPEWRCTMTNDQSLLDQSDAVLFHEGALFNFWRGHPMPEHRSPDQVWILYNVEPPTRSPLNFQRFNDVFNWTAWYRRDSDVPVPYGGYDSYPTGDRYGSNRSVYYARENQRRCPETVCSDTISNYKFFLALENANCRDYVTEKFWGALARRQVPVVLGGASSEDYRKIAPPNSFLHVNDFPSVTALVQHLQWLARNEAEYNKLLDWTRHYDVFSELPARRKWWCRLCKALHDRKRPAQVYSDLQGWVQDDTCPQWTLGNQIGRYIDGFKISTGLL
nr:hypothetical protein BaRGS_020984 [Batillaria attramentaria]